ncbi:hypothetical protein K435DRAFT_760444 [Dendrothele bispora CBS 962.96]|uniref:Nephrocystin 3-like N-terminal domain-containing protein n=1 Tax=Dendrothele bispora (strain CBS 962.96) TaxID=1314807 RepID=A0A4S8LM44_DENBC|nr:hypothetical protein K435DRAFT_760444 [Dendrothele bispora CBS 962.96]
MTAVHGDQNTYNYCVPLNSKETGLQHLFQTIGKVDALHTSQARFPPPKCHDQTRTVILGQLSNWIKGHSLRSSWRTTDFMGRLRRKTKITNPSAAFPDLIDDCIAHNALSHSAPIHWLYGPAGVGKSAIAQTICENSDGFRGKKHLAASFFFSRSSPTRNHPKYLILTIAYCLATSCKDSRLRATIDKVVKTNPAVLDASLSNQFRELVIKPINSLSEWRKARLPKLVVIDGLDECLGSDSQKLVLNTLFSGLVDQESEPLKLRIPLRFLIASRPEPTIRSFFKQTTDSGISIHTYLDNDREVARDIAVYLRDEFALIYQTHRDSMNSVQWPWPPEHIIQELVHRASGQFIYASTVLKYVGNDHHENLFPPKRLEAVLALPLGDIDKDAFADLDILYHQILDESPTNLVVTVLAFVLLTHGHRLSDMHILEQIFLLPTGAVSTTLRRLHSVLSISLEDDTVNVHHKSFEDFLGDEIRSKQYYIDSLAYFEQFMDYCRDAICDIESGDSSLDW